MRLEMAQGGVLNEQSAQEKLQRADQIAALQNTVTQLESRVEKMDSSMKQMQGRIAELESRGGCACTIS
jgi:phage shock protein A